MRKWAARIWLLLVGVVAVPFWFAAALFSLLISAVEREPLRETLKYIKIRSAELCAVWLEAWEKAPGVTRGD